MKFIEWNDNDVLTVNKFGIPEPLRSKKVNYLILS